MNIVIAAHYNLNNGDRALLEATLRIINSTIPNAHVKVSAYKPEFLVDKRFEVVPWALYNGRKERILLKLSNYRIFRRLFRVLYKLVCDKKYVEALNDADLILISGGHHLTDILSKEGYYKLSSNFIIPVVLKKKTILLPQSIGPASDADVKESIKYILNNVSFAAYRDDSSKLFIDELDLNLKTAYVPDFVYSLEPDNPKNLNNKTVGVALYHSYAGENKDKILPFTIKNLILIIDELLERGYDVKIIPMDDGDEQYANDICSKLKSDHKSEHYYVAPRGEKIMDIINEFCGLSFVLAYKTHSTIFSMICNSPLIAIAYHPKSIEFMDRIGLVDFAIEDKKASFDNIIPLINKIESNNDSIREQERVGVENNRKLISNFILEMLK